jgi:Na+-transporting methylmalonyl-CoA/oxaloacetate decarboxylase beta subunit
MRVAPLMVCALLLYEMTPDVPLNGMMLMHEMLRDTEVAQRIKDTTMDDLNFVFPIPGHPAMRSASKTRWWMTL